LLAQQSQASKRREGEPTGQWADYVQMLVWLLVSGGDAGREGNKRDLSQSRRPDMDVGPQQISLLLTAIGRF
jgi:hypothetical protein